MITPYRYLPWKIMIFFPFLNQKITKNHSGVVSTNISLENNVIGFLLWSTSLCKLVQPAANYFNMILQHNMESSPEVSAMLDWQKLRNRAISVHAEFVGLLPIHNGTTIWIIKRLQALAVSWAKQILKRMIIFPLCV